MAKVVRPTASIPDVMKRVKRGYEQRGLGYRKLSEKYGVPRTTIAWHVKHKGWRKPDKRVTGERTLSGAIGAAEVETAILAQGLRTGPYKGPAGRPRRTLMGSIKKGKKAPGSATAPPEEVAVADPTGAAPPPPGDQPDLPPTESGGWLKWSQGSVTRSADIINFPAAKAPPRRESAAVQLLPDQTREEKAKLRITLSAIRSMMTLEQVDRLDRHNALLERYAHLIDVYLSPHQFVDTTGLDEAEAAEKIVGTQKLALSMLLPTDRDTLAGAVKTYSNALRELIELQRKVAGLDRIKAGSLPIDPPEGQDDPERQARGDLAALHTNQLRAVQQAMETLERHQHASREAPKPPPPDSIDDLLDPNAPPPAMAEPAEPVEDEVPR